MAVNMEVEVRSGVFYTSDGKKAKRGDRIMVPVDESAQSGGVKAGLKSGRLHMVGATMDTSPSSAITQEDLDKLKEENEELKKERTALKGQVTKLKNAQANAEGSEEAEEGKQED